MAKKPIDPEAPVEARAETPVPAPVEQVLVVQDTGRPESLPLRRFRLKYASDAPHSYGDRQLQKGDLFEVRMSEWELEIMMMRWPGRFQRV